MKDCSRNTAAWVLLQLPLLKLTFQALLELLAFAEEDQKVDAWLAKLAALGHPYGRPSALLPYPGCSALCRTPGPVGAQ
jgi:hypothetical protein